MRKKLHQQLPIVHPFVDHEHAAELQVISDILDSDPGIIDLIYADLVRGLQQTDTGRQGMTAEQVLRAMIIKQMNGYSYDELAFHLADSCSYRTFCRLGVADKAPPRSTLQRNIKRLRPETLEAINQRLLGYARDQGIERGRKVRFDCTVTETHIHHPTDSSLLWDCVRVLTRLVLRGRDLVELPVSDHRRRAKRRALGIKNAKTKKEQVRLYRDLLKVSRKTVSMAERMVTALEESELVRLTAPDLSVELRHYLPLVRQVIDQAERRVLSGESVPSVEKIVSIFESHTDIIVKDRRDTLYGHKLCLATGASGLVLDCVVEEGNPADSTLAVDMVAKQRAVYKRVPRQVAFDGGFASKTNLAEIKELGVKDVAFAKKRGLKVTEMVKSSWVYKRLRDWRAGMEGMISFLKRCFGLDRCQWRGLSSFGSYVWSSVVTANLLLMARQVLQ